MESSIAVFLLRQPACERLPTYDEPEVASGTNSGGRAAPPVHRNGKGRGGTVHLRDGRFRAGGAGTSPSDPAAGAITRWQPQRVQHQPGSQRCSDQRRTRKHHIAERGFDPRTFGLRARILAPHWRDDRARRPTPGPGRNPECCKSNGRERRAACCRCTEATSAMVELGTCALVAFAPTAPAPHRWRPYRVECTGSLPTSEVKRRRARLVLGWGTAREDLRVLPAFACMGRRHGA